MPRLRRVAGDVVELLDEDGAQAAIAHAAFLSFFGFDQRRTKTSSMEGVIRLQASIDGDTSPAAASAWRIRALVDGRHDRIDPP